MLLRGETPRLLIKTRLLEVQSPDSVFENVQSWIEKLQTAEKKKGWDRQKKIYFKKILQHLSAESSKSCETDFISFQILFICLMWIQAHHVVFMFLWLKNFFLLF